MIIGLNRDNRSPVQRSEGQASLRNWIFRIGATLFFAASGAFFASSAGAQSQSYTPVVLTPPIVDMIDETHVSVLTGMPQFSIPAVQLGDVSFAPYSVNGPYFTQGQIFDNNYGRVVLCENPNGSLDGNASIVVSSDCVSTQATLQAVYGQERAPFQLGTNGQYTSTVWDGSTFVDNGSTCTWTKRDGTQIVFAAFHTAGNPACQSNNISQIIHPDGRIETYYYYGALSTASPDWTPSPIISIATNSGYLLKYNYSGTPTAGGETSVVAFNRAFVACDPAATSCSPTESTGWPTATLSWVPKSVSPSDGFLPSSYTWYNGNFHYIFTIQTEANKQHVFEVDSFYRVISYQPPEATTPKYSYSLCSLLADGHSLRNCFGYTYWYDDGVHGFEPAPLMFDKVNVATLDNPTPANGQQWTHGWFFGLASPPYGWATWTHNELDPLGMGIEATGNSTPGMEAFFGPTDHITNYDGSSDAFERSARNYPAVHQTAAGVTKTYGYSQYGNLLQILRTPIGGAAGTGTSEAAVYPTSCVSIVICYKPTSVTDANANTVSYTYDPVHGGVLTETDPLVNGVTPQTRHTYIQLNAWYLQSSGAMTSDPNPIWVLASDSYCMTGNPASPGPGCSLPNDEVVTTYDYGPTTSGPNNLILRGKAVTWMGQTLRTCYGHDSQGNKIWETSPNANPSSCPSY